MSKIISDLRNNSRKLVRELGMLQLSNAQLGQTPLHWHSLIEISKTPGITISKLGQILLLSVSTLSRIVNLLIKTGYIDYKYGIDRREKHLYITNLGKNEITKIDEFSNSKIKRAFALLNNEDIEEIVKAIMKYGNALEQSRLIAQQTKILTISTSRTLRKQIIAMIENIQKNEFSIAITPDINACILKAEEVFHYNNSYNFWYAIDNNGEIIGSIGLKKIDDNYAELKKFFVVKKYRSYGIAQKLLKTLIKSAIKHGFTDIVLGSVDILYAAQTFYSKYGFSVIHPDQLPQNFELCPVDTIFYKANIMEIAKHISSIED